MKEPKTLYKEKTNKNEHLGKSCSDLTELHAGINTQKKKSFKASFMFCGEDRLFLAGIPHAV